MDWGLAQGQSWIDVVQLVVLLLGATAAAWKWIFSQQYASQRESPTLNLSGKAEIVHATKTYKLYVVGLTAENPGTLPVFSHAAHSNFTVHRLPGNKVGPVVANDADLVFEAPINLLGSSWFEFEPKSKECFNIPFRLTVGANYLISFRLSIWRRASLPDDADPPITEHSIVLRA